MRVFRLFYCVILVLILAGCATPVGVNKVGLEEAYREINANALNGDELSSDTKVVLRRFDLLERYEKDPAATIALLNEKVSKDNRRDLRFALAELSFHYGEKLNKLTSQGDGSSNGSNGRAADYFLMSAVYAYHYLLGAAGEESSNPYDRRFRVACDFYNRALGKGLATGQAGQLEFRDETRDLPIGSLKISLNKVSLPWPLEDFVSFVPADDYAVRGLTIRNRTSGLGAPLVALHKKTPELPNGPALPVTIFLRLTGDISDLASGTAQASLEFHFGFEETEVLVNGRTVPLETDSTTPLAYKLNESFVWELGFSKFFSALKHAKEQELILIQPYQPGRIPVVFVHGTASSPVWWAEMWNTLNSDPVLRKHCEFWFFMYNSSVMLASSADAFRNALTKKVSELDPGGQDPGLRQMVIIGHSQGGLLTKMSVIKPGDRLWHSLSDLSLEELKADPPVKEQLRKFFFIEPLPFVTRAVYIATPFRGSFLAKNWVRNLVRRFVSLPKDILTGNLRIFGDLMGQLKLPRELRGKVPTSVDSMSPDNPVLKTLAELPVVPGVKSHSIIAVKGEGDPTNGNDGVVEYKSAHQDGVESEFIVRTSHSCQGNPLTIEEVRRILLEHIASQPGAEEH